jgi:hypothetical protein
MFEILRSGIVANDEELMALIEGYKQIVLPQDDDVNITHWWAIRNDGIETLYVGNVETFDRYVREQNGGLI